ncbi:cytidylyltransferase domain-containing protein [Candidatus Pelagibacter sp.]|uniref:cytidylyltransferase domain-containing protein n=1 Tax=Candidatus Pelagibacter sp. TaxID=2024849 RepID=UPI003F871D07
MKIVSIVQARMNSSRLPGKVLMKINGKPMISFLTDRLRKLKKIDQIIIATTKNKKDDQIVSFCKKNKLDFYRGSEKNVLKRIFDAANFFKADIILFITGDCPLIDIGIIEKQLIYFIRNRKKLDYLGNSFIRSYPVGMDFQIFNFNTLKKNFKISKKRLEQEHVTLGIKRNSNQFKIKNLVASKNLFWPELGLTLDEKEDFILIKKIILYFKNKNKNYFNCSNIINLLKKKNNWIKINSHIIRKGDT